MSSTVVVYAPNLLGDPGCGSTAEFAGSSLATLLSRSEISQTRELSHEALIFQLFGYPDCDASRLPIAPVTALVDQLETDGHWWLRIDPVHLVADRDRVYMRGAAGLDLSPEEVEQLLTELAPIFEPWSTKPVAGAVDRWYVALPRDPHIEVGILSSVIGHDIHPYMPAGNEGRAWRRLLNEIQIVLHDCSVNQSRRKQGRPVVNSVWIWGGGILPVPRPASWREVWSRDILCQGLAKIAGINHGRLPDGAAQLLEKNINNGKYLIVLSINKHDIAGPSWENRRSFVEEGWIQPLFKALKKGTIRHLQLNVGDGLLYDISHRQARRWWIRTRPLS